MEDEIKALQEKRVRDTFAALQHALLQSSFHCRCPVHATPQANGETAGETVAEGDRIGLMSKGAFDSDIYGAGQQGGFASEVQEFTEEDDAPTANHPSTRASINADRSILDAGTDADSGVDPFAAYRSEVGLPLCDALGFQSLYTVKLVHGVPPAIA